MLAGDRPPVIAMRRDVGTRSGVREDVGCVAWPVLRCWRLRPADSGGRTRPSRPRLRSGPMIVGGYAPADANDPDVEGGRGAGDRRDLQARSAARPRRERRRASMQVVAGMNYRFTIKMTGVNRYRIVVVQAAAEGDDAGDGLRGSRPVTAKLQPIIARQTASRPRASTSSNAANSVESTSSTATSAPAASNTGTTISELERRVAGDVAGEGVDVGHDDGLALLRRPRRTRLCRTRCAGSRACPGRGRRPARWASADRPRRSRTRRSAPPKAETSSETVVA